MNVLLVCVILFALWRGYAGMKKGMVDEIRMLLSLVISLFVISLASDRRNRLQHEPALRLPLPSEMSVCDGKLQTGSAGALQCFPRQQSSGGVPICNCAADWRRTRIRCEDAAGCRRAEMEIKVTWENI